MSIITTFMYIMENKSAAKADQMVAKRNCCWKTNNAPIPVTTINDIFLEKYASGEIPNIFGICMKNAEISTQTPKKAQSRELPQATSSEV